MKIPEPALNALADLIRSGVDQCAVKLTEMTRRQWLMQVASVKVIPGRGLQDSLPNGFEEHYGVYFNMPDGMMLVLLPKASGESLVGAHLGMNAAKLSGIPNLEHEVIGEISQILANMVAAKFADLCDTGFLMSAPDVAFGTKNYLYSEIAKKFPQVTKDLAITSYVHMSAPSVSADFMIYILLSERLTSRILARLAKPA